MSDAQRRVEELFARLCEEYDVEASLEFRAYKRRIALVLLRRGIVRLNVRLLDDAARRDLIGRDEPCLVFVERVLRHELVHLKLRTVYHPPGSFQTLV